MTFPLKFHSFRLMPTSRWTRIVVETLVLLGVLLLADAVVFKGDHFAAMPIHPFGAVVLLMSVQYGLFGGAFATVASIIAVYWLNGSAAEAGSDYYDSMAATLELPTLWLGAAVVFGGLRNLHLTRESQLRERCEVAEALATELSESLRIAVAEINTLERRIASDTATVTAILSGVSRLDRSSVRAFSVSAQDMLSDVCGASAHAIYSIGNVDFRAVAAYDEENASPATRMAWASRDDLVAQFSKSFDAITHYHPRAASLLAPGAQMMAPIGDVGFVVIERLRAGNILSGERLRMVAAVLAAHWPQNAGLSALREDAAA